MPNFKVGDIVRGIDSSRYQCTNSDMTKGGVTYIRSDGYFDCIILEHKHPEKASCEIGCEHTRLDPKYFELVPKFAVGQIYRSTCEDGEKGNIVKIVDASGKFIKYDTIRGIKRATLFFNDSTFANGLVLLTGKQIGEAIKAFDAKKAEPSGVKEVKRAAKPGEYIKITNPWYNRTITHEDYKKGEILKVRGTQSDGNVLIEGLSDCKFINPIEYVVLEGYSPVKEVKRRAKVGETVKAISNNGGFIYEGKTYKAVSVHEDGAVNVYDPDGRYPGMTNIISSGNYVVVSFGKHVWTPEEVERAKTIVLDCIREIYEESKGSVMFSRDAGSDKIFDAYLIEKGLSRLGYRPWDNALEARKVRKGTAKCSDTDEPNEWIGKCVALCKVLHKPIPSFIMGD